VTCVFCLYVWCAATDPGDPGIFRCNKNLKVEGCREQILSKESKQHESEILPCYSVPCLAVPLSWCGMSCMCNWCQSHEQSSEQQMGEEGMFYCSLCEVEVLKNSKHCRVCDKCVDGFDHHCRWINNCVGRQNYRRFFILMASALLLVSMLCPPWASFFCSG
ncbi:hypothetical protein BHE74_00003892, partial [Ensete ventricosum]